MTTRTETQPLSTATARRSPIANLLRLDSATCLLNGIAYLAGATILDDLLGPSVLTLEILGIFLLVWGGAAAWVAARDPVPRGLVMEIVIGNVLWVAASVAVAFGLLPLTGIGLAWCLLQAVVVAALAAAQYAVVRR